MMPPEIVWRRPSARPPYCYFVGSATVQRRDKASERESEREGGESYKKEAACLFMRRPHVALIGEGGDLAGRFGDYSVFFCDRHTLQAGRANSKFIVESLTLAEMSLPLGIK